MEWHKNERWLQSIDSIIAIASWIDNDWTSIQSNSMMMINVDDQRWGMIINVNELTFNIQRDSIINNDDDVQWLCCVNMLT